MSKLADRLTKLEADSAQVAERLSNLHSAHEKDDIGWIGKCFGSRSHAPTNIAAVVAVTLAVVLAVLLIAGAAQNAQTIQLILSALLTVLAYIFGRGGGGKDSG